MQTFFRVCTSYLILSTGTAFAAESANTQFLTSDSIYSESASIESRVFGGGVAENGEWPSMAGIAAVGDFPLEFRFFCGGTVISDRWILTAAHCVFNSFSEVVQASDISVVVGINDLQDETAVETPVSRVLVHPQYDALGDSLSNDIALLELQSPVAAPPVALFDGDTEALNNTFGHIAGWGATGIDENSGNAIFPNLLQDASVPFVPLERCNSNESYQGLITDSQVCAGYIEGGIDACVGDSGGPLFLVQDEQHVQVGITSFGNGCGLPNFYGVYTDVASYLSWIKAYVDGANTSQTTILANGNSTNSTGASAGDVGSTTVASKTSDTGSMNLFFMMVLLGLGNLRFANTVWSRRRKVHE